MAQWWDSTLEVTANVDLSSMSLKLQVTGVAHLIEAMISREMPA
jgi:hypothetical protein